MSKIMLAVYLSFHLYFRSLFVPFIWSLWKSWNLFVNYHLNKSLVNLLRVIILEPQSHPATNGVRSGMLQCLSKNTCSGIQQYLYKDTYPGILHRFEKNIPTQRYLSSDTSPRIPNQRFQDLHQISIQLTQDPTGTTTYINYLWSYPPRENTGIEYSSTPQTKYLQYYYTPQRCPD